MNKYSKLEKIGEGAYGSVYRGLDRTRNEVVAIKTIQFHNEEEGVPGAVLRELSILRQLHHPAIVCLKDFVPETKKIHLIFEYMKADLCKYLSSYQRDVFMDPALVRSYMKQILEAITYCHQRSILHRDLKPDNLLLDGKGRIKVSDFGISRTFAIPHHSYTSGVVTLWYRAPELLLGSPDYGSSVDVWSIGCIFSEMASKKPLFEGDSEIDQLFKIFQILSTPTEDTWPSVSQFPYYAASFPKWTNSTLKDSAKNIDQKGLDLLQKMLVYEPSHRISTKNALQHPFFAFT